VTKIEVFQSGDGPERTSITTDVDGRFSLGGWRQGPVFPFARGEGFRFFGRLIQTGDHDITVELTRTNERPAREMRMLPDAFPLEESRALARRLIEPYCGAAVNQKNQAAQNRALRALAWADPVGVLQRLEKVPLTAKLEMNADSARIRLAELPGLSHEERFREIWGRETFLGDLFDRDLR
jgi:hypothetical protein